MKHKQKMVREKIKMTPREWRRVQAAAQMSGETCNAFVRRASYQKALTVFLEKNLSILENFVGDAFDNYIHRCEKGDSDD